MKRVLFIILFFNISLYIFSERYGTVYTPTGKSVEAIFDKLEFSASQISSLNSSYATAFPQALFLSNASNKYNAHSWAWHIWEGGSECCINIYDHMGAPNLSKYWSSNGGYVETTAARAEKIFYYASNLSAVPSPDISGWYESKWGSGPRMCHAPNYGPYSDMNKREYFERGSQSGGGGSSTTPTTPPSIDTGLLNCSNGNGPIGVNISATYSTPIIWPDNYTFEWRIETTKGTDIIGTKATISNQSVNSAVITFSATGVFEIYLTIYNLNGDTVAEYTFEPAVEL